MTRVMLVMVRKGLLFSECTLNVSCGGRNKELEDLREQESTLAHGKLAGDRLHLSPGTARNAAPQSFFRDLGRK